jgi:hypothetical protein
MKVLQSYDYSGSIEFTFSVDELESGVSLFSDKSGIGGIDFMPADGDTVTVYSNVIGTSGQTNFKPTLNNKLFYLVSNDLITDREQIISEGIAIAVALSGGRYEGSFVFSNPSDFQYLYLVSDYTNNIPLSGSTTHTYANGATEVIDIELDTTAIGLASMEYTFPAGGGRRVAIEYNGTIVADTGEIAGPVTATLKFIRTSIEPTTARLIVQNKGTSASFTMKSPTTSLTSFYLDSTAGTLSTVCGQIATDQMYHNGTSALPVAGDIIYSDSLGSNVYDGENAYHVISTVIMGAPSASSVYASIATDGHVLSRGTCMCSEVAIPVITQGDITVAQNQQFSIYVEVTNNPNSWTLVTSCNEYELDGGIKGAIFTYTDCYGDTQRTTVSSNKTRTVCASALPTLVTGTGTISLIGPCQETSLPEGIQFVDGVISGTPVNSGKYTIELIATNCFGDSANTTFDIIAESTVTLTPFEIDVQELSTTGADACLLAGSYDLLYHNGRASIPDLNDTIFMDPKSVDRFVGGKLWYKVAASLYSVRVDEFGVVIDKHTC